MPAQTTLLEFRVEESFTEAEWRTLLYKISADLEKIFQFEPSSIQLPDICKDVGIFLILFVRADGSHALLRGHPSKHLGGLITLDLHEFKSEESDYCVCSEEMVATLQSNIASSIRSTKNKRLPAIRRGAAIDCYYPTTDGLLIEYDFDRLLYEADSQYQNVKVLHSRQFGNVIILDDDPNMGESDLAYTHAIINYGQVDYRDKTVLILGGGDGGVLHELRKEHPKFITMIDIDEMVVDVSRTFLRGVCFDSLDQLQGDNYEVIVGDCIPFLKKFAVERRLFDVIINDLTSIPITLEPDGDVWEFIHQILNLSMKILKPTGRCFAQGNGTNMTTALDMYESQLNHLEEKVNFRRKVTFVPSYHEGWVFYEIWKDTEMIVETLNHKTFKQEDYFSSRNFAHCVETHDLCEKLYDRGNIVTPSDCMLPTCTYSANHT